MFTITEKPAVWYLKQKFWRTPTQVDIIEYSWFFAGY